MKRVKLPSRRPDVTGEFKWTGPDRVKHLLNVSVGYCVRTGTVQEVFAVSTYADASVFQRSLDDICILISRLLQFGETLESLHEGLGALISPGVSASSVKSVIGFAIELEADRGASVDTGPIKREAVKP